MDLVVTSYCIYLLVGVALTLKVGQLLNPARVIFEKNHSQ